MATETEVCRFCGTLKSDAKKFYKAVGKEPYCDLIYFCNKCKKVLDKANWFKNRKIEEVKE